MNFPSRFPPTAGAGLLLAGCSGVQSALNPAGPGAERIGILWWWMLWTFTAILALVAAAVIYSLWRNSGRDLRREVRMPERADEGKMTLAVVAVTGATLIILFALQLGSFFTDHALAALPPADAVQIQVTGHQWWWEIRYLDPQPHRQVTTANEVHIPVGRPVTFILQSQDVIHSLWIPNLHGKKDLIPGYEAALTVRADLPGLYRGQCAEYCGYQHAHMSLLVEADTPEAFSAWLEKQRGTAAPPDDPLRQRGLQVFLQSPCVMCHAIQGTTAAGRVGPDLTHVGSRRMLAAGTLSNSPGNLGGWIVDSQRIKPGNHMPPNILAPQDLQALIAYLGGLQ